MPNIGAAYVIVNVSGHAAALVGAMSMSIIMGGAMIECNIVQ